MILRLRDLTEPGRSLHQVLVRLAHGIHHDMDALPDDTARRVHDIRVATKKIRSLLRLAGLPRKTTARLANHLRTIRAHFAGSRDDDVMRGWVCRLLPESDAAPVLRDLGLESIASADIAPCPALPDAAQLIATLERLDLSRRKARALVHSAARAYARARKAMAACRKSETTETMHTWRKRIKDVSYHAQALRALPPMDALARPLDKLADQLGNYHDLAVLHEHGHKLLLPHLATRLHRLGADCFRRGNNLLSPKPAKFEKSLLRALR